MVRQISNCYYCKIYSVADPGFGQGGGPIGQGGPTLKREGFMPDFISSCAKQCKMYALTLGLGEARASGAPLDPLLILLYTVHYVCVIINYYHCKY